MTSDHSCIPPEQVWYSHVPRPSFSRADDVIHPCCEVKGRATPDYIPLPQPVIITFYVAQNYGICRYISAAGLACLWQKSMEVYGKPLALTTATSVVVMLPSVRLVL